MYVNPNRKRASIHANEIFICIQTNSGYRRSVVDIAGRELYLSNSATQEEIGIALSDALNVSRFINLGNELDKFLDYTRLRTQYEEWISRMCERFNTSRRDLFLNMRSCHVESTDGITEIWPTNHVELERWTGDGIEAEDIVVVRNVASSWELGEAALRALERCL